MNWLPICCTHDIILQSFQTRFLLTCWQDLARTLVSKQKRRFKNEYFDLDLSYIQSNIIAMGFPSEGTESLYRNPMPEVQKFFQKYHKNHYKVYASDAVAMSNVRIPIRGEEPITLNICKASHGVVSDSH